MSVSSISSARPVSMEQASNVKSGKDIGSDFIEMLEKSIDSVNARLQKAENLSLDVAAGKEVDLPTVMTAINKADISFRMFLQVRNKALSAYEEIMRLQF